MDRSISRRHSMRQIAAAGLGAGGMLALPSLLRGSDSSTEEQPASAASSSDKRPNIVFILIDDLAATAVGYAKRFPFLKTPNIDRIAAEGAVFENFFVCNSLCSPSRATFLTGAYSHVNGVVDNTGKSDPRVTLFPQEMQKAGYETAFLGKWHMVRKMDPRPGFDYWLSFLRQGKYTNNDLNENGKVFNEPGYITEVLTDRAVKYIKQPRSKPFCMMLWHKAVHSPFTPADRHKDAFADAEFPQPSNFNDSLEGKPAWQRRQAAAAATQSTKDAEKSGEAQGSVGATGPAPEKIATQPWDAHHQQSLDMLRCVLAVDDSVGRVMDALKQTGQLDDTLIIFAGDNGYLYGEHHRGDKRLAYEESIRIPMAMRCPAFIKPGTVIKQMGLNIDIAPTLLELAHANVPATVQGMSLMNLLSPKEGVKLGWRDAWLYEYYQDGSFTTPPMVGVRTEDWKYVTYPTLTGEIDELYDLKSDPIEMKNLAGDPAQARKLAEMKQLLDKLKKDTGYKINLATGSPE